mmetsp:Transcript_26827/g.86852  ORF Transcript_26827/g.86852 Transcript_26827/m.86852 type:complete len:168 (-) Transcript_26827:401-904(-)
MKHTISVLVDNESGVLTRITGLFARRGFNIESLTVGPTELEKISRLIVVLPDTNINIEQLTKQLYKLINVRKVQNISDVPNINRELMLLKVKVNDQNRSKILEITTIFDAKIVDFSKDSLTIEVAGESDKIVAFEQQLRKFNILEMSKTGKVALLRNINIIKRSSYL